MSDTHQRSFTHPLKEQYTRKLNFFTDFLVIYFVILVTGVLFTFPDFMIMQGGVVHMIILHVHVAHLCICSCKYVGVLLF